MVTDKEKDSADEVSAVREELAGLQREKEGWARQLEERDTRIAALEQTLAERDSNLASCQQSLDEAESSLSDAREMLARAVAGYKALVVEANPGVLAEMIKGDTVEEVNEFLQSARTLTERVRQEMEAENARTKVPAGAPQRTPLDMSGLSPRDKIQYAIGGNR